MASFRLGTGQLDLLRGHLAAAPRLDRARPHAEGGAGRHSRGPALPVRRTRPAPASGAALPGPPGQDLEPPGSACLEATAGGIPPTGCIPLKGPDPPLRDKGKTGGLQHPPLRLVMVAADDDCLDGAAFAGERHDLGQEVPADPVPQLRLGDGEVVDDADEPARVVDGRRRAQVGDQEAIDAAPVFVHQADLQRARDDGFEVRLLDSARVDAHAPELGTDPLVFAALTLRKLDHAEDVISLGGPDQAVEIAAAASRPSSFTDTSRISTLRTLPVTVIGNSSTNFQWRGTL